jgi:hypothetical protein
MFALPISVQAHDELTQIQEMINEMHMDLDLNDERLFAWGGNVYKPSKFYKFVFALVPQDRTLKFIWKSKLQPKLKVFAWLLVKNRLNTKDLMVNLEALAD